MNAINISVYLPCNLNVPNCVSKIPTVLLIFLMSCCTLVCASSNALTLIDKVLIVCFLSSRDQMTFIIYFIG